MVRARRRSRWTLSEARWCDVGSGRRESAKRQIVVHARAPWRAVCLLRMSSFCLRAGRAVVLKCGGATACLCTRLMLPVSSAEIAHALVRSASLLGAASPHRQRRGATSNQPIRNGKRAGRAARSSAGPRRRHQARHGCSNIAYRVISRNPGPAGPRFRRPCEAKFVPGPALTPPCLPTPRPASVRARPAAAYCR